MIVCGPFYDGCEGLFLQGLAIDKRTSTVGRVMPHTQAKIVDIHDRTKILPIGEKGELATAGYLVCSRMFNIDYIIDKRKMRLIEVCGLVAEVLLERPGEDGRGYDT